MKRIIPVLIVALFLFNMVGFAAANTTLFYDGFNTAGFPTQWSGFQQTDQYNITQTDNYLTLKIPRVWNLSVAQAVVTSVVANQSALPIVGPGTKDGQTIFMAWRLQAMNFTSASQASGLNFWTQRRVEVDFGLRNPSRFSPWNQIIFKTVAFDTTGGSSPPAVASRSQVAVSVVHPMASAATCFDNDIANGGFTVNACAQNTVPYETPGSTIDLNAVHLFVIYAKFYPVSHTSWIAFNVDGMGWLNMTQQACTCIDQNAAGGSYAAMYPTIRIFGDGFASSAKPYLTDFGQTTAAFLNYVIVNDYQTVTLPTGTQIGCATNGSCPTIAPKSQRETPTDIIGYFGFVAFDLGKGNWALGGAMLSLMMLFASVFLLFKLRARNGFTFAMLSFGITGIASFTMGLPVWVPVVVMIVILFVSFVLRSDRMGSDE